MQPQPITLAVVNLKGGAGKSTCVQNLGACLQRGGYATLLIDIDPQRTTQVWAGVAAEAHRAGPAVVAMEGKSLSRDLARVARPFQLVLIDAPPRLGQDQRAAMLAADAVLMPFTPGPADVWALRETLVALDEVRVLRPEIRAYGVQNRLASRTTLSGVIRRAVEAASLAVLTSGLASRVAYPEAMALGQGVTDYAPRSPAAGEIEALAAELMQRLREAA